MSTRSYWERISEFGRTSFTASVVVALHLWLFLAPDDLPMDTIFEIMDPIFEMCFEDALEFPGFCNTHGHPDRHYISHPLMISMCCASCSATRWTRARCHGVRAWPTSVGGPLVTTGMLPALCRLKKMLCVKMCFVVPCLGIMMCVLCFVVLFKKNGVCLDISVKSTLA